ncbi:hypothetical protein Mterra_02302 [Calidithermus terrae]|uniref:Lipoprotein n=1 Tax=Calidithermus terrae TaxID=1408545 RepID=A0A399EJ79_9DEIN|nr:hypothetical protein [Calidithermus terrae]RIH83350.1 hypothetical protein Mterra_02302 [Calidithermus terrae]
MKRWLLALLAGAAAAGCAPRMGVPALVDPSLSAAALRQSSTSVLPVALGQSVRAADYPDVRRLANERVANQLPVALAGIKLRPVAETLEVLQKSNLVDAYAAVLFGFEQTGVINGARMNEIAKALDSRYVVVPFLQKMATFPDRSNPYCSERYESAFYLVIYDASLSKTVYEGTGTAAGVGRCLFGGQTYADAMNRAIDDAARQLTQAIK